MSEIYGPLFASLYGSTPNHSWKAIFSSVSADRISIGFERLTAQDSAFSKFPPNSFEFRDLCNPKPIDYGLPWEPEAFNIAANWKNGTIDKHPAVLHAIRQLDFYNWSMLPTEKARKEFNQVWLNTVDHVMNGGKFAPIIPDENRIEQKPMSKEDKAEMSGKLAEFRKGLRGKRE